MKLFVGLDVSLGATSVCLMSEHSGLIKETEAPSDPEVLAHWLGGLTPSRKQSDERDASGGTTLARDVNLRRALCQAATVMMNRGRSTWLRTWGAQLAQWRDRKIALIAFVRRIAVILHQLWADGSTFQADAAPNLA